MKKNESEREREKREEKRRKEERTKLNLCFKTPVKQNNDASLEEGECKGEECVRKKKTNFFLSLFSYTRNLLGGEHT